MALHHRVLYMPPGNFRRKRLKEHGLSIYFKEPQSKNNFQTHVNRNGVLGLAVFVAPARGLVMHALEMIVAAWSHAVEH